MSLCIFVSNYASGEDLCKNLLPRGVEPYDVATLVEFHSNESSVRMVLTFDAMHDEEWTKRAVMGHESQLDKLEKVIAGK